MHGSDGHMSAIHLLVLADLVVDLPVAMRFHLGGVQVALWSIAMLLCTQWNGPAVRPLRPNVESSAPVSRDSTCTWLFAPSATLTPLVSR